MDIEEYRAYCLALPGVTESMPFDDEVLVFKVGGKMFALAGITAFEYVNLKCSPEQAVELRARYAAVRPGYHMSKKHWNSVYHRELMDDALLIRLIRHSYAMIYASLTKKGRAEIPEGASIGLDNFDHL